MATSELITSVANPLVKWMRSLADRRGRRRNDAFVVQGVQPVWLAVEAGWRIETLIAVPDVLPDSARGLVEQQRALGVRVAWVSAEVAARFTDRDRPPGLFAVLPCRQTQLAELTVGADAVFVALHAVSNPGNLGTIVRTADAAGAAGVILVGDTADQYAPSAVKASMGSLFAMPIARADGCAELFDWAGSHHARVVATSGYAERTHWSLAYSTPLVVLFGNEGDGLPAPVLQRADEQVRVPMVGSAESLNLAVAAGLVLYEARRAALEGAR